MAKAAFSRKADTIDYTATATLAAGDVVVAGSIVGVAKTGITINTSGALLISGVFRGVKDASVFAVGDRVYWNPTGDPVGGVAGSGAFTAVGGGNALAGVAVSAALTGDASFDVELNPRRTFSRTPVATVAAAGSTNADATLVAEGFTLVTAADGTKGVKLPTLAPGASCTIKNGAAAVLKIYPGTGKQINGLTATTGSLNIAANTIVTFTAYDTTNIYSSPLLPS